MDKESRTHDVRDAFLIAAFFAAYGIVALWMQHGPRPTLPTPRLEFARSIRDKLIAEENRP